MDNVDATSRYSGKQVVDLPSLLVVILDTNPYAWDRLNSIIPLHKAIGQILVFINAHLAFSQTNKAAIIASHTDRAVFLSPPPPSNSPHTDATRLDNNKTNGNINGDTIHQTESKTDANKYRAFRLVEDEVVHSLQSLMSNTNEEALSLDSSMTAGAISLALTYINKTCFGGNRNAMVMKDDVEKGVKSDYGAEAGREMNARILVVSVSEDMASQYIPVMNSIFAAQRKKIPIDVCKLHGDSVFLQQASDATAGIYMSLEEPQGLLQYLMMAFLPDHLSRQSLVPPTQVDVDFRAACFCHKKVLDIGFVCSICLSIFCAPPPGAVCSTCTTKLDITNLENIGKPTVVRAMKKKKKKKTLGGTATGTNSAAESPAPS